MAKQKSSKSKESEKREDRFELDSDEDVSELLATGDEEVKFSEESDDEEDGGLLAGFLSSSSSKEPADPEPEPESYEAESGNVLVRGLWPGTVKIVGPSGNQYVFEAGQVQEVAPEDVEHLMSKNHNAGRACCGGESERYFFELA